MSLRDVAAADHAAILSDSVSGFAATVTVMNPAGMALTIEGMPCDVGELVDPETGVVVVGRNVTCQLRRQPLIAAGMGEPRAIADGNTRPWTVTFADTSGTVRTWKIVETAVDRVFDSIRCTLEAYRPA